MKAILKAAAATLLLAGASRGERLSVTIASPPPGVPLFGQVLFAVAVDPPGGAASVRLLVDGEVVGSLTEPPFTVTVDVGESNREHRFEAQAVGAAGEQASALLVTPAIRVDEEVDAELQQLYVTVVDGEHRVLDLGAEDFAIVDNGALQELVTFARGDVRLTAMLLVDASASMVGTRLRYALRGAASFVEGMKPDDDASIVLFSDRMLHETPFSNDLALLTAGLGEVRAEGGTALNDYLYFALKRLEEQQGRRVVVLLSDGVDSHSALRMPEVTWLARRSRALLYWIRTDPRDEERRSRFSAWKNADEYRAEYRLLTETVRETGGRIVTLDRIEGAAEAFRDILQELREQYVLGYYPSNARNDGSWHQTHVRVRRNGLLVRARNGYIDY